MFHRLRYFTMKMFCQVCILWTLVDQFWTKSLFSQEAVFFSQFILQDIRTGSFSQEFSCSDARNIFRGGPLHRKFSHSTEHIELLGHCKYLLISSLRIKKDAIIFPGSKQIPKGNTQAELGLMQNPRWSSLLYYHKVLHLGCCSSLRSPSGTPQCPRKLGRSLLWICTLDWNLEPYDNLKKYNIYDIPNKFILLTFST